MAASILVLVLALMLLQYVLCKIQKIMSITLLIQGCLYLDYYK